MPYRSELKRPDLKGQFPCSVCSKIFCHSSSLSRHRMQAHFKSYICMVCNQEISSNETLRSHMMKQHDIARMFMCRCCNWAFPDKTSLHVHTSSLTKNGPPADCKVLARSFAEGDEPIGIQQDLHNSPSSSPPERREYMTPEAEVPPLINNVGLGIPPFNNPRAMQEFLANFQNMKRSSEIAAAAAANNIVPDILKSPLSKATRKEVEAEHIVACLPDFIKNNPLFYNLLKPTINMPPSVMPGVALKRRLDDDEISSTKLPRIDASPPHIIPPPLADIITPEIMPTVVPTESAGESHTVNDSMSHKNKRKSRKPQQLPQSEALAVGVDVNDNMDESESGMSEHQMSPASDSHAPVTADGRESAGNDLVEYKEKITSVARKIQAGLSQPNANVSDLLNLFCQTALADNQ